MFGERIRESGYGLRRRDKRSDSEGWGDTVRVIWIKEKRER